MNMRLPDLLRLVALATLWGGSFLLYRIVTPMLGAVWSAEWRVGIAGLVLLGWQYVVGPRFSARGNVRNLFVVGAFNSAVPFTLFGFAAHALPAAYLAIINATSPLFGALIARWWLGEALEAARGIGIVVGLVGVAALVGLGPVAVTPATLIAANACLLGAASYGFAGNYARRMRRPTDPATMATGSQFGAALFLAPGLPFTVPLVAPSTVVVGAVLVLAVGCTSIAYLLYFRLIRDLGATRALTVTFLIPLFAIGWAWAVLGEAPTPRMAVGGLLVILATWLVVRPAKRV